MLHRCKVSTWKRKIQNFSSGQTENKDQRAKYTTEKSDLQSPSFKWALDRNRGWYRNHSLQTWICSAGKSGGTCDIPPYCQKSISTLVEKRSYAHIYGIISSFQEYVLVQKDISSQKNCTEQNHLVPSSLLEVCAHLFFGLHCVDDEEGPPYPVFRWRIVPSRDCLCSSAMSSNPATGHHLHHLAVVENPCACSASADPSLMHFSPTSWLEVILRGSCVIISEGVRWTSSQLLTSVSVGAAQKYSGQIRGMSRLLKAEILPHDPCGLDCRSYRGTPPSPSLHAPSHTLT